MKGNIFIQTSNCFKRLRIIISIILLIAMTALMLPAKPVNAESIEKNYVENGTLAQNDSASELVEYAFTQEGNTGSYYAETEGIFFDWCVWFVTFCASNVELCGTPDDPTGNLFPPIEPETWEENDWAATGVIYSVNWLTANDKGLLSYFEPANNLDINSNTVHVERDGYTPRIGDLIYFDWYPNDNVSRYHHVAIVYDYDDESGIVSYIGGNQGNSNWRLAQVTSDTVSKYNSQIAAFFRPNYGDSRDYLEECDSELTHAIVESNSNSCALWTYPCESDVFSLSTIHTYAEHEEELIVTLDIVNTVDEIWYQVAYDDGYYYVKDSSVQLINYIDDLEIESISPPVGELPIGEGYPLTEVITSRHLITSVMGRIIDSNGNIIFSQTVSPNVHGIYDITGSAVDSALRFGQLEPGCYSYVLTAVVNASSSLGESETFTQEFTSLFYLGMMAGDANDDGVITLVDALLTMHYSLGVDNEPGNENLVPYLCDMNGDGEITVADSMIIGRMALDIDQTN